MKMKTDQTDKKKTIREAKLRACPNCERKTVDIFFKDIRRFSNEMLLEEDRK